MTMGRAADGGQDDDYGYTHESPAGRHRPGDRRPVFTTESAGTTVCILTVR